MPELSASFQSALDSLYNYKPSKVASGHGPYPKLDATVTFHDKHMDPRLALHKVILAPSLVNDLVKAGERALQTYKDRTDVELPPVIDDTLSPLNSYRKVVDARTVALVYSSAFAEPATTIASMLLLHPNAPNWSNSMFFIEDDPTKEKSDALNEDFTPIFRRHYDDAEEYKSVDKDAWESMDDPTKKLFQIAYEKFNRPAVWHIYFVRREARRALKRMGAVVSRNMSTYPTFRTDAPKIGPGSLDLPFSPDALETAWGMSLPAFTSAAVQTSAGSHPLRRSRRLAAGKAKALERPPVPRKKAVPSVSAAESTQPNREWSKVSRPLRSESVETDEGVATSLLHRAWARAVEKDATFIVLHCGTYERIAIRHRSSQTLFLSDLINVTQCSDPAYGAIHVGLFISILSDVLDRVAQIEEHANQTSKKRRRSALSTIEPRKRPRTRTTVTSEATRIITEQKQLQVPCFFLLQLSSDLTSNL
ncbi:hypothetical protein H0H93_008844 [Arthromyces matolae]|nr:hypothetical protein H0H93_008844 [Arthromyces matolae]